MTTSKSSVFTLQDEVLELSYNQPSAEFVAWVAVVSANRGICLFTVREVLLKTSSNLLVCVEPVVATEKLNLLSPEEGVGPEGTTGFIQSGPSLAWRG